MSEKLARMARLPVAGSTVNTAGRNAGGPRVPASASVTRIRPEASMATACRNSSAGPWLGSPKSDNIVRLPVLGSMR